MKNSVGCKDVKARKSEAVPRLRIEAVFTV
jgi:hypothetical protein